MADVAHGREGASEAWTSRLLGWAPFVMLLAAFVIGCRNGVKWLIGIHHGISHGFFPYVYWIMRDNYFSSGFTRRGLASSVFTMLNHGMAYTSMSIFSLICAAFLLFPISLFILRLTRRGRWEPCWFAFLLLVSPHMLRFWGADTGHGDMLNCAFVAWALLATLDRRYLLAAAVLLVGSLNHETVLILGVPLCAAFWFLDWRERQSRVMDAVKALAVLAIGLVAIAALQHVFSASPQQIARAIATGPTPDHSAWLRAGPVDPRLVSAYMTSGGVRTLFASNCIMYLSPGAYIFPLSCFVTLLLYIIVYPLTSKVGLAVFTVACLLPMTFLSIIAIDYGRWLAFAVMNGWLAAAALSIRGREPAPYSRSNYALGVVVLLALLALGSGGGFASATAVRKLGTKLYGPTMNNPAVYLQRCDPQWTAVALGTIKG